MSNYVSLLNRGGGKREGGLRTRVRSDPWNRTQAVEIGLGWWAAGGGFGRFHLAQVSFE